MINVLRATALALLVLAAHGVLVVHGAGAAEIVRRSESAQSPILQSVTIPPGSEIVMLSGVTPAPIDPTKKPDSIASYGDTKTQTISAFEKIKSTLQGLGYSLSDIVRITVYVAGDLKLGGKMDFASMIDVYKTYFGTPSNKNLTARTTVQVAALGSPFFLVEFEVTAAKAPK